MAQRATRSLRTRAWTRADLAGSAVEDALVWHSDAAQASLELRLTELFR